MSSNNSSQDQIRSSYQEKQESTFNESKQSLPQGLIKSSAGMSMATSYNYQSNVGSSLVKVKDPSLIK
jgi:hypothetical protein